METRFDVVVVGGGVAGMTAGMTAARLGRRALVITGDILGGQLASIEKIEGYPGFIEGVPGYDLLPMAQEQAENAGAEFMMARLESLVQRNGDWLLETDQGAVTARGVVLATGASLRKLDVPGEQRLFGKGVSHCAGCDGPLLRGRVAIVAGGGDSAMQEALTLAAHASKVILIERGGALTGQASYRARVAGEAKIELRFNTRIEEILGDVEVVGVRARDVGGEAFEIPTSAVFAYIGLRRDNAVAANALDLDADGAIPVDSRMRARPAGLCAAGNARSGSSFRAIGAAGDGANAAAALDGYLATGEWPAA